MTPGARVAAAIDIIDQVNDGRAAEQALTRWARASRFAGSGDREAVRDHVYDVIRNRRTYAAFGGGETGRALMLGQSRANDADLDALFSGVGHAPEAVTAQERGRFGTPTSKDIWNLPDWLIPLFKADLGDDGLGVAEQLARRAPITLRVNVARISVSEAAERLAAEGIKTIPNPRANAALTVIDGTRRIRGSDSYKDGLIELQDASSQAMVEGLPEVRNALDYCAGGGGKALAMAARGWDVTVHDSDSARMKDIPARSARAGVTLTWFDPSNPGLFDLVLCDVPCSGSGSWRRAPETKWSLKQDDITALNHTQADVISHAKEHVRVGGYLVYATCSIFAQENNAQIERFKESDQAWTIIHAFQWDVSSEGDGFYVAHLRREV